MAIGRDRPRPIAKACRHCLVHVDTTHIPLIRLVITLGQHPVLRKHERCCSYVRDASGGIANGPKDFSCAPRSKCISRSLCAGYATRETRCANLHEKWLRVLLLIEATPPPSPPSSSQPCASTAHHMTATTGRLIDYTPPHTHQDPHPPRVLGRRRPHRVQMS